MTITMDALMATLTEMFNDAPLKTVGDLVKAGNLEGMERLPDSVLEYSLAPDVSLLFPASAFCDMHEAGVTSAAMVALGDEIYRHKSGRMQMALEILKP